MLVNGQGDAYWQNCPVGRGYEDPGWNMQCPMYDQWSRQPATSQCGYVPVPKVYPQMVNYVPQVSILPNIPCRQQQDWNYNSMCFNVDGEPCQYTEVIDLEDMMNNEKRKEKSRVAARTRRNKEMHIFAELTAALPARKEDVDQLDKASIMRPRHLLPAC
ncbi:unnamed protein product [Arctia plantaginis]|uniref:BHLH domain-containing protein n=1 Tax=Arctia plantaginis TaxID=874455 RepID=A0A8S1AJL7_ARCPL|nr:unnamed protein product [Arctia plantaginis]